MNKSVYIVLVNYNGKEYLDEFMESLKGQTYSNYRVVFVDSASSDGSAEMFRERWPECKAILKKENVGFARGCNIGIEYARRKKADYVLLLNIDTVLEENLLEELVKHSEGKRVVSPKIYSSRDRVDIWYGGGDLNYETGCHAQYHDERLESSDGTFCHEITFASGCCMLIPMSVINKVGNLDEKFFMYYDDDDLSFRFKKAEVEMRYIFSTSLWHKVGGSYAGKRSILTEYYFTRNRLYLMRKHKDVMQTSCHKIAKEIFEQKICKASENDKKYVPYVLRGIFDFYTGKLGKSSCKF